MGHAGRRGPAPAIRAAGLRAEVAPSTRAADGQARAREGLVARGMAARWITARVFEVGRRPARAGARPTHGIVPRDRREGAGHRDATRAGRTRTRSTGRRQSAPRGRAARGTTAAPAAIPIVRQPTDAIGTTARHGNVPNAQGMIDQSVRGGSTASACREIRGVRVGATSDRPPVRARPVVRMTLPVGADRARPEGPGIGHDLADLAACATAIRWRARWARRVPGRD
jgi:hypothetical protein